MSVVTVARTAAGRKGTGWLPNRPDALEHIFVPRLSVAARKRLAAGESLASCVPVIFDQGSTSSCVAQAIAGAVATREMFLSMQLGQTSLRTDLFSSALYAQLSRRALYSLARATHGDHKNDDGTYIRAALQVLRRHGCPLEDKFAWSALRINETVPAPLLFNGYELADLRYEAITEVGDAKLEAIREALADGHPVVFGSTVHESYGRLRKHDQPYAPKPSDTALGGHAQYIVGIDQVLGHVDVINSWGRSWGNEGRALVHAEHVVRAYRDLTIMRGWRRAQAAEAEVRRAA